MFFYILHNTLPESGTFTAGKRNCATFLFGVILYLIVYVILCNLRLKHGIVMDAILTAFYVLVVADASVMAWIYKDFYGRNILNELDESTNTLTGPTWVFDESTHKYVQQTKENTQNRKSQSQQEDHAHPIVVKEIQEEESTLF